MNITDTFYLPGSRMANLILDWQGKCNLEEDSILKTGGNPIKITVTRSVKRKLETSYQTLIMRSIQIKIAKEIYQVVQNFTKINLYQVFSEHGNFEITKTRSNGTWKILAPNAGSIALPINKLGKVIEQKFGVVI